MGETVEEKVSRLSLYRKQYFRWRFVEGHGHTEIARSFRKLLELLGVKNLPKYGVALTPTVWSSRYG